MSVITLIPARSGSKGIPGKNLRQLGGKTLIQHAVDCARASGCEPIVSTDYARYSGPRAVDWNGQIVIDAGVLARPPELAQDDTPMFAVVQHALRQIPGTPEDIIVLLQPTQPFRTPAHVREAIRLLQETQADSVVSVVELPLSHSPDLVMAMTATGALVPFHTLYDWDLGCPALPLPPTRRQDARQAYLRDGTCYVFWRKTVEQHGTIYGRDVLPLLIDPEDSCELDTELDWAACVRRWEEKHG